MAQINYFTKLDYSNAITANLLNIEYDEVLYKSLPRESNNLGQIYYGSEPGSLTSGAVHRYPFSLVVEDPQKEGIYLWQERDKSFSISASIPGTETVTTTPCFDKAVNAAIGKDEPLKIIVGEDNAPSRLNKTFNEMLETVEAGQILYFTESQTIPGGTATKSFYLTDLVDLGTNYVAVFVSVDNNSLIARTFAAVSADDYPTGRQKLNTKNGK